MIDKRPRKILSIKNPGEALVHLEFELLKRTRVMYEIIDGKTVDVEKMSDTQLRRVIADLRQEIKSRQYD